MHSSVTERSSSSGRSERSVSSSADASLTGKVATPSAGASLGASYLTLAGAQFIHAPEVQIPGNEHLDAIAVRLGDGRRNIDRRSQHFRHHIAGAGRVDDQRAPVG